MICHSNISINKEIIATYTLIRKQDKVQVNNIITSKKLG